MRGTEVTYHSDYGRPGRPAINVKVHGGGPMRSSAVDDGLPDQADELHEQAWEVVAERFWDEATAEAEHLGLGAIEQEGRSGGWLVIPDITPGHPDYEATPNERRAWLRRYDALRRWCADYVSRADGMTRELSQDMAIERVSRSAVRRMFGREYTLGEARVRGDMHPYYREVVGA